MRVLIALGGNAMTGPDGSATPQAQREAIARGDGPRRHRRRGRARGRPHPRQRPAGRQPARQERARRPRRPAGPARLVRRPDAGHDRVHHPRHPRAGPRRPRARPTRSPRWSPARWWTPTTRGSPRRPSRSAGSCPTTRPGRSSSTARRGRTAATRAGAASSPPPSPSRSSRPTPLLTLLGAGYVVVAAGGGGIPVVRDADGSVHGVEAVIDKDLTAAVLARAIGADALVIATDVENAVLDFGTPRRDPLGRVPLAEMEGYAADGQFASGSMGPKVEAAMRFVRARRRPQRHHRPRPHRRRALRRRRHHHRPPCTRIVTQRNATEGDDPCPSPSRSARSRSTASSDASELAKLIDDGVMDASRVIAIIGKTEGNGGVNDYTRIIADRAFREVLVAKGAPADQVKQVPIVWSGGTDGDHQPARDHLRHRAGRPGGAVRRAAADGRVRDERADPARGDRLHRHGHQGRRRREGRDGEGRHHRPRRRPLRADQDARC